VKMTEFSKISIDVDETGNGLVYLDGKKLNRVKSIEFKAGDGPTECKITMFAKISATVDVGSGKGKG